MSVGERIKRARQSKGISQKTLADAIGIGENTLAGWEKDRNSPPSDKVSAMASFFQCSTDEILMETAGDGAMLALVRRFNDLPDDLKSLARNLMSVTLTAIEYEADNNKARTE